MYRSSNSSHIVDDCKTSATSPSKAIYQDLLLLFLALRNVTAKLLFSETSSDVISYEAFLIGSGLSVLSHLPSTSELGYFAVVGSHLS